MRRKQLKLVYNIAACPTFPQIQIYSIAISTFRLMKKGRRGLLQPKTTGPSRRLFTLLTLALLIFMRISRHSTARRLTNGSITSHVPIHSHIDGTHQARRAIFDGRASQTRLSTRAVTVVRMQSRTRRAGSTTKRVRNMWGRFGVEVKDNDGDYALTMRVRTRVSGGKAAGRRRVRGYG